MIIVTPAIQINTINPAANPQNSIMAQTGGQPIICPNGTNLLEIMLATSTVNQALSFPFGVTTAVFVFIAALTTTDLIVTVGSAAMPIPARQGILLYGLTSGQFSVSSVAGGQIQYAIGG